MCQERGIIGTGVGEEVDGHTLTSLRSNASSASKVREGDGDGDGDGEGKGDGEGEGDGEEEGEGDKLVYFLKPYTQIINKK